MNAGSDKKQAKQRAKSLRALALQGMREGKPVTGPMQVHIDITNGCNAKCITCWDHSPLLKTPRSNAWKGQRISLERFLEILAQLDAMDSVQAVVVSGMGDPLTHPQVYEMLAAVKERGWHLTVLSNLVAADMERLCEVGVDNLLVGVHGATPQTYMAFHPTWTERHFNALCMGLRKLRRTETAVRHVHVINRDTAHELVQMVRFGHLFRAQRVNFKLASLDGGTQDCAVTPEQVQWMLDEGIPAARQAAEDQSVHTNLELFEKQVRAWASSDLVTADMDSIGCFMGYVYSRITVDQEVLYCCNTHVQVGSLVEHSFQELWQGERWQKLRDTVASGRFFRGCERCGKVEQNIKWNARFGGALHHA